MGKRSKKSKIRYGSKLPGAHGVTKTIPLNKTKLIYNTRTPSPFLLMRRPSSGRLLSLDSRAYLAEQLTSAYDAYLEIQRRVDQRIKVALGRDDTWDAKNVCPPCFYRVEDEAPPKYSFLGALDGGSSLKLVDSTFRAGNPRFDNRKTTSFRWLTPTEVDRFKDEVSMATPTALAAVAESLAAAPSAASAAPPAGSTPAGPASATTVRPATSSGPSLSAPGRAETVASPSLAHLDNSPAPDSPNGFDSSQDPADDVAWLNINELTEQETDELTNNVNNCVERWKAAGPEARKKIFALFAVAGIFISVRRHSHRGVLSAILSFSLAHLMKYPLTIVARLLELHGSDIALGYDIISLGRDVVRLRLRGVVPAWHEHAHNRSCQLGWHPMYMEGVGLEDFEECERTFSLSNHLASCTRLATGPLKVRLELRWLVQTFKTANSTFTLRGVRTRKAKILKHLDPCPDTQGLEPVHPGS
ncbi:hypothetical protein DFH08DRAFT_814884 [Mycena albidolilacea]|uniref:Uncharacterized protein n=1 Tax=Mycena albidolilacea TaxID=1033008 RepID=A0AAD6ZNZ6_9AGAR|nr:hypothetical protein DFH08DRAFT_814884 [Mycena albidolilacea]